MCVGGTQYSCGSCSLSDRVTGGPAADLCCHLTVRASVSSPVSGVKPLFGDMGRPLSPTPSSLLPLVTVPTTAQCRKPSGGLIYPPPTSLAGSHRKSRPQGPLQACEDSQWLGGCDVESPGRAMRWAGSQENRARQGWELGTWAGVWLRQSFRSHLSICPFSTHPHPEEAQ